MLDGGTTMIPDAERSGRASGKEIMARPRDQDGSLVVRGKRRKMWVLRWRDNVLQPDGTVRRIQHAETLGPVSQIKKEKARGVLQERVAAASQGQRRPHATMKLADFVGVEWRPNAELALKESSVRNYGFQFDRYISPALGSVSLCDLNRAQIEVCLSNLRQKGYGGATLRGVRATLATVLRTAVERGYLEKNPAHGIRIREMNAKPMRRFYSPVEARRLLAELPEPCRTVVLLAVLTGMRIGEILALRWKRVDLLRGTIEIAESFSSGQFGSPKTRSSTRVIPMSSALQSVLKTYRAGAFRNAPDDLVFCTSTGTPLNSKNLYNRALAPACDRIKQPRVSWHSFRHTHATQLAESGESLKTAQALLGHSDLETTLNTYMHVIPESQRRAVEQVAGVLFSNVLRLDPDSKEPGNVN
jgi:integrase